MATELDRAYDHCQQIAREHAKNFYYAFRTLPEGKRRAIYATYAFCRVCDDVADDDIPLSQKKTLLDETRQMLREAQEGQAQDRVFLALQDAATEFDIPFAYFEDLLDGVEMDLTWTRFQSFEELRSYCYKVASTVGLICIEVFGYRDNRARDYAEDLGLAMQLTNIIRDVKEDAERGRIYIPLDEMARFGYSEAELIGGVANDAFVQLMRYQAERARGYFQSGHRLLPLTPVRARSCPAVLHGLYSALLDRIEASGFKVFEQRISLSTREKVFLTARIWAASLIPVMSLARR